MKLSKMKEVTQLLKTREKHISRLKLMYRYKNRDIRYGDSTVIISTGYEFDIELRKRLVDLMESEIFKEVLNVEEQLKELGIEIDEKDRGIVPKEE